MYCLSKVSLLNCLAHRGSRNLICTKKSLFKFIVQSHWNFVVVKMIRSLLYVKKINEWELDTLPLDFQKDMLPNCHFCGFFPGTLSSSEVSATHLKIGHPQISFMGAWSSNELQWLDLKIWHQDSSSSNGCQGDMSSGHQDKSRHGDIPCWIIFSVLAIPLLFSCVHNWTFLFRQSLVRPVR